MQGARGCRVCARRDRAAAAKRFWGQVAARGGHPARDARYVDAHTPVDLTSAAEHRCAPIPNNVVRGTGICDRCATDFDRVYLLVHPAAGAVKVGIASGDRRVREHTGRGYRLIAQWADLEHDTARSAERAVLIRWRDAGMDPVPGAPRIGRSETAPMRALAAARTQLGLLLGAPTEDFGAALLSGAEAA